MFGKKDGVVFTLDMTAAHTPSSQAYAGPHLAPWPPPAGVLPKSMRTRNSSSTTKTRRRRAAFFHPFLGLTNGNPRARLKLCRGAPRHPSNGSADQEPHRHLLQQALPREQHLLAISAEPEAPQEVVIPHGVSEPGQSLEQAKLGQGLPPIQSRDNNGVMRLIATRRFARSGPGVLIFKNCSP